jgi:hypothetical protein
MKTLHYIFGLLLILTCSQAGAQNNGHLPYGAPGPMYPARGYPADPRFMQQPPLPPFPPGHPYAGVAYVAPLPMYHAPVYPVDPRTLMAYSIGFPGGAYGAPRPGSPPAPIIDPFGREMRAPEAAPAPSIHDAIWRLDLETAKKLVGKTLIETMPSLLTSKNQFGNNILHQTLKRIALAHTTNPSEECIPALVKLAYQFLRLATVHVDAYVNLDNGIGDKPAALIETAQQIFDKHLAHIPACAKLRSFFGYREESAEVDDVTLSMAAMTVHAGTGGSSLPGSRADDRSSRSSTCSTPSPQPLAQQAPRLVLQPVAAPAKSTGEATPTGITEPFDGSFADMKAPALLPATAQAAVPAVGDADKALRKAAKKERVAAQKAADATKRKAAEAAEREARKAITQAQQKAAEDRRVARAATAATQTAPPLTRAKAKKTPATASAEAEDQEFDQNIFRILDAKNVKKLRQWLDANPTFPNARKPLLASTPGWTVLECALSTADDKLLTCLERRLGDRFSTLIFEKNQKGITPLDNLFILAADDTGDDDVRDANIESLSTTYHAWNTAGYIPEGTKLSDGRTVLEAAITAGFIAGGGSGGASAGAPSDPVANFIKRARADYTKAGGQIPMAEGAYCSQTVRFIEANNTTVLADGVKEILRLLDTDNATTCSLDFFGALKFALAADARDVATGLITTHIGDINRHVNTATKTTLLHALLGWQELGERAVPLTQANLLHYLRLICTHSSYDRKFMNQEDSSGNTPLHLAITRRIPTDDPFGDVYAIQIISYLLNEGAVVDVKALDLARDISPKDVLKKLLDDLETTNPSLKISWSLVNASHD